MTYRMHTCIPVFRCSGFWHRLKVPVSWWKGEPNTHFVGDERGHTDKEASEIRKDSLDTSTSDSSTISVWQQKRRAMSIHQRRRYLLLSLVSSLFLQGAFGFIPLKHHEPKIHVATGSRSSQLVPADLSPRPLSTALTMSSSGGGSSKGIVTAAGLLFIVILFVGGSILPMMDMGRAGGGVAPLANSVATRDQGAQQQQVVTNDKYRLSRAAIQEKLNTVPVFYVVGGNGEMGTDLYLSYNDAKDVAGSKIVKATTLDQVE